MDMRLKRLSRRIATVAVMRGERYGGSVEWPLMASRCVASAECAVQFPEVNVGIIPGWDGVLNVRRYEALRDDCRSRQPSREPKELAKYIDERPAEMGRPVAPLAAEAVFGLLAKGARLAADDLEGIEELAYDEVASCSNLMKARDGAIGVNSILGARQDPLNKIAIFERS